MFQKKCRETLKHTLYVQQLFFKNCAIYVIRRKNTVDLGRSHMTIRHINLRLQTHTEYVILTAFPLQQWLLERTSLRYTYIACLVKYYLYTDTKLRYNTTICLLAQKLLSHATTPILTLFLALSISTLQFTDLNKYTSTQSML
jgi:hypothetical protein